jgi:hypothetical protein
VQDFGIGAVADPIVDYLLSLTPRELSSGQHVTPGSDPDPPPQVLWSTDAQETISSQYAALAGGGGLGAATVGCVRP